MSEAGPVQPQPESPFLFLEKVAPFPFNAGIEMDPMFAACVIS